MRKGEAQGGPPFFARYSPIRVAPYLLGSLIFVGLAGFLFANVNEWSPLRAGIVSVLFCGAGVVAFGIKMLDRRVQIRVDNKGLMLLAHSDQSIPLRSIKRITNRGAYLAIDLYKPEKYPPARPTRRWLMAVNDRLSPGSMGDVFVQHSLLDCRLDEFYDALSRHKPLTAFERKLAFRAESASDSH